MPYTISHAVIALPLLKIFKDKIPLVAIIVASMSPDFPYLLALTPVTAPGHSFSGVLIYCLIPSLLILVVWFRWLEQPTLQLLHLPRRAFQLSPESFIYLIIAVLIGAYSHIIWDASSHEHGWIVASVDTLQQSFINLPLYKWNQYLSGVAGLIILFVWYVVAVIKNRCTPYQGQLGVGVTITIACVLFFITLANVIHNSTLLSDYVVRSAIGVINGMLFAICLYAFWVHAQINKVKNNQI